MKTHTINVQTGQSEIRDLTSEEETKANADIKKAKELKDAEVSAKTTKANNKASGKAKLKSGEALTDDEISALFGA